MPRPSLSILIPTRNREALSRIAVENALQAAPADAEIIVSDNGDAPLTLPQRDPRLRVLRGDRVLSMPDNWERALEAARGEWLIMLSDKCRIVPGGIETLFQKAGPNTRVITYFRTNFIQEVAADRANDPQALSMAPGELDRPPPPTLVEVRPSADALREWYRAGAGYPSHLPMLYNALVHHSVIDSARARSPRFFIGMAPDVASGLQIATHSTHYTWTSFPLTTVQAPSRTPEWSNGLSCERGGSLARRFHDEFGNSPLRRYRMPLTGASIVFSTILDFRRIHPDVAGALPVGWDIYARIAAQQIEGMDPNDRLRLHSALLRATQREGIDPRAIGMQLRMWGVSRFPRLYRQTLALRRRFGLLRPPPRPPYGDRIRSREESLSAALRTLAREAGVESHGHDNRHSPAGWQASS